VTPAGNQERAIVLNALVDAPHDVLAPIDARAVAGASPTNMKRLKSLIP
jgi:hypothetical protein